MVKPIVEYGASSYGVSRLSRCRPGAAVAVKTPLLGLQQRQLVFSKACDRLSSDLQGHQKTLETSPLLSLILISSF